MLFEYTQARTRTLYAVARDHNSIGTPRRRHDTRRTQRNAFPSFGRTVGHTIPPPTPDKINFTDTYKSRFR